MQNRLFGITITEKPAKGRKEKALMVITGRDTEKEAASLSIRGDISTLCRFTLELLSYTSERLAADSMPPDIRDSFLKNAEEAVEKAGLKLPSSETAWRLGLQNSSLLPLCRAKDEKIAKLKARIKELESKGAESGNAQ